MSWICARKQRREGAMPKSPNQKLKLLYLMEILLQQTDERHPMTVPEMISELARHGVAAERKSIYNDLESLRTFGLDIVQTKSRTTGYYIGARSFEVPELKLLVDSVQSSKFITHKKTLALIKKIEGLASIYDAQLLQRQVYVRGRVKSMNESVYYNVDEIVMWTRLPMPFPATGRSASTTLSTRSTSSGTTVRTVRSTSSARWR